MSFLYLLGGSKDPGLFQPDLDWYYGCYDSECGLESTEGHIADVLASGLTRASKRIDAPDCAQCGYPMSRRGIAYRCARCKHLQAAQPVKPKHQASGSSKSDPFDEYQVRLRCEEAERGIGTLTRGRRIWNRLVRLPYAIQEDIRLIYEPRRERATLSEERVRAANLAYSEGAKNV